MWLLRILQGAARVIQSSVAKAFAFVNGARHNLLLVQRTKFPPLRQQCHRARPFVLAELRKYSQASSDLLYTSGSSPQPFQRLRATVLFLPAAKPKISFAENGTTPVNAVVPFLMLVTKQSIAVGFVILQTTPCLRAPSANTQSLHRRQPPRQLRPPLVLISPPDYVLSLSCPTRLERLACPISWALSIWFTRVSTLMFGLTI